MTLVSLISRQIWPQVLLVAHFKPVKLVLVHTDVESESRGPSRRLKHLIEKNKHFFGEIRLSELLVPHDKFEQIGSRLDGVLEGGEETVFNITGGNKLMSTAAFEKGRLMRRPVVYLERENTLVQFFYDGEARDVTESKLDASICNALDAADLCECQSVEATLSGRGERLTLSAEGQRTDLDAFMDKLKDVETFRRLSSSHYHHLLEKEVFDTRDKKEGDPAEYITAFVLLKLGVPCVYRSLEFTPITERNPKFTEGELDLVFNYNGSLWIVDCKDKDAIRDKIERTKQKLSSLAIPMQKAEDILHELTEELEFKDKKVLREDMQQVLDVGGIQGRLIAVRSSVVPKHVKTYVKSRGPRFDLIHKNELHTRLKSILHPNQPASAVAHQT